jgi:hypothetical protein
MWAGEHTGGQADENEQHRGRFHDDHSRLRGGTTCGTPRGRFPASSLTHRSLATIITGK